MALFLYVGSFFFIDFDDDDDFVGVDCIVTADIVVGSGYVLCAKRNFVGAEKDAPIFCSTSTLVLTTRYGTYSAWLRSVAVIIVVNQENECHDDVLL